MPLYFNGNKISDFYFGGNKVGEAWFNGQKVYSSVPPFFGINYIFRDIDAGGNLTLATGWLEETAQKNNHFYELIRNHEDFDFGDGKYSKIFKSKYNAMIKKYR
jgi:hypothetical protein